MNDAPERIYVGRDDGKLSASWYTTPHGEIWRIEYVRSDIVQEIKNERDHWKRHYDRLIELCSKPEPVT